MIENFKRHHIIVIFSIIFLTLMLINYTINRSFVKEILINEQVSMLKNSSNKVEKWLENKKHSLKSINQLISKFSPEKDEQIIKDILQKSESIANFSSIYVGYENSTIISSKEFIRPSGYAPINRPWYQNTIKSGGIYITKPYIDAGLKKPVVSICQKINSIQNLGVLCGILLFDDIKNELSSYKLENNGFIFLTDDSFKPLIYPNDNFKNNYGFLKTTNKVDTSHIETKNEILSFKKLENSTLILIAKTPKNNIYDKINEQFIINFAIYILSIFLFLILAYFYNKKINRQKAEFEKTKREYEILLFSQAKMAELGQMIGAISHQWIQPLNSLSIFLGNLVQFKKLGKLSDDIFYENTKRSLENIDYMANTMSIFKNFYRLQTTTQKFDIKQAILDTIFILFTHHSNVNIKVTLKSKTDTNCINYINEFKQIIACLVQNSKEALKDKKCAKIVINITKEQNKFIIRVIDNADGIKTENIGKIFTPFSSTKNSSGLGLYISKLIANKKLKGDLVLQKSKNPTIFTLTIAKENV
ncbi:sensor histidine kinase [Campylobacter sp. faydin G-24]|uniref:Sensor histidine kinase n=1 Tax=Campylobacter anatolicus TaxID=2829105 RepID=A0ABS5HH64_9BACT|nr:sensor histidine kinase [Campylobacter anatolicus]MBR8463575.1 sensor histidine kinase [Campylobacter anatolicus]